MDVDIRPGPAVFHVCNGDSRRKVLAETELIFMSQCHRPHWLCIGVHVFLCMAVWVSYVSMYSTRSWPSALVRCLPLQAMASLCTRTLAGNGRLTWLCCSWSETVRKKDMGHWEGWRWRKKPHKKLFVTCLVSCCVSESKTIKGKEKF